MPVSSRLSSKYSRPSTFLEITPAILEEAALAGSPLLRTLDAIHLATALSVDDPELAVIVYDERLAEAARAAGLTVVQPGIA